MSIDLKPCPFCGSPGATFEHKSMWVGPSKTRYESEGWSVQCDGDGECGLASSPTTVNKREDIVGRYSTELEAIKAWNTRHGAAKVAEQPVDLTTLPKQLGQDIYAELFDEASANYGPEVSKQDRIGRITNRILKHVLHFWPCATERESVSVEVMEHIIADITYAVDSKVYGQGNAAVAIYKQIEGEK